jgi:monoamine oxidase
MNDKIIDEPDIAIIGAGAAGIGAARRLAGSGLSVLLLEALPRTGGRAWTRQAAGVPLDLGCEWLHSADRNPWTRIAEDTGFTVDRRNSAWDRQDRTGGLSAEDWEAAHQAFEAWSERIAEFPPDSDIAAEALEPGGRWTAYLQAMSGFISGDELERISARDYAAYDQASTYCNWRLPAGYGTLITASLPASTALRLTAGVEAVALDGRRIALRTSAGTVRARAAICTVSTSVLAGGAIAWPAAIDPWREAACRLPLGRDEKLFFEITGDSPFTPESHALGDPFDPATGSYYIRPFGHPVISCFLGGAGARAMAEQGADAAFARALDQLVSLFGADVRRCLRPLMASDWAHSPTIGGAYSHALPGQADARAVLARPYDDRLFFAGEATHTSDFSTAHGAYFSGLRAAEEALAVMTAH